MKANADNIQARLNAGSYEKARREAVAALKTATGPEAVELRFQLHSACRKLNDIRGCTSALAAIAPETSAQRIELLLRQAEDCKLFSRISYSESDERRQGLSHWEYFDRMDARGKALLEEARALVETAAGQKRFAAASAICNEGVFSAVAESVNNVVAPPGTSPALPSRKLEGFGPVIARPSKLTLALIDGQELEYKGIRIASDGPAVQVEIQGDDLSVVTSGSGNYAITRGNQTQRHTIRDREHTGL